VSLPSATAFRGWSLDPRAGGPRMVGRPSVAGAIRPTGTDMVVNVSASRIRSTWSPSRGTPDPLYLASARPRPTRRSATAVHGCTCGRSKVRGSVRDDLAVAYQEAVGRPAMRGVGEAGSRPSSPSSPTNAFRRWLPLARTRARRAPVPDRRTDAGTAIGADRDRPSYPDGHRRPCL
jgi:hypothetical protein